MFILGRVPTTTMFEPSMKILVWNYRGAGNNSFCRNFLEIARTHCPSIVVFTETRISGARAENISIALGFDSVCRADADVFRGGIWLLWHSGVINLNILSFTTQAIHATV
jgi:hypothetical protein